MHMPVMVSPEDLADKDLSDLQWFAGLMGDLIYAPGQTQESLEQNLHMIREVYRMDSRDGLFLQMFDRIRPVVTRLPEYDQIGLVCRIPYTADDFLYTEAPYREIVSEKNGFRREQIKAQLEKRAKSVGVNNFRTLWNQYDKAQHTQNGRDGGAFLIPLHGEDFQLNAAGWHMDASGIWKEGKNGQEYACTHPIAPVRRLTNIDTGEEKLTVAFERSGRVRYLTRSKRELFDGAKILDLSAVGVAVTSQTAKTLSRYLCEIEDANYDEIPQQDSVGRLGFLDDGRFSPYVEDVAFDGDAAYSALFSAIRPAGDFEAWRRCAVQCRQESLTAQIMLAASFASVLIKSIGALPFFVHLWGGDSGTGKTVALMLAASVWGDPELGGYPQTFNATVVGHEKTAAFLGNIPMCIDELQLSKDSHGRSRFDVYQLAQGVGRTRGNKQGGIDRTPTWSLCILTTGESPIVQENAGAGAVNRVIDIECRDAEAVVRDGQGVCKIIRSNFGMAGRKFIESLTAERLEQARHLYDMYFRQLLSGETTEKQAMAAALILTADALADVEIFMTGKTMTAEEIGAFLKSRASVSAGERGYSYMCDWVAVHAAKFSGESNTENYGVLDGRYVYINRSVFRSACKDAGFDERALLSWLKSNGLILTRAKNNTRGKRINGVNVECVVMRLPDCGVTTEQDDALL